MKKNILLIIFTAFFYASLFAQVPANDNCSGALPIALGNPPPCGTGLQAGPFTTVSGNITFATPGNPYIYQPGCSGSGGPNQAFPANDIWYSFVATGFQCVINITSTFANPNVAFYSGNCAALGGGIGGCAVGSGGAVTLTVNQLVPGTTYYLQISGNTGQTGTFTMQIQNNKDCADCLVNSNITVNPLPTNGAYAPNTTVNFCFHIGQYNTINTNWLHGVQLSFGSGWNAASVVPNVPTPLTAMGTWSYYPGGIGVQNAQTWGAGWYFDSNNNGSGFPVALDGNPKNNYGDSQGGASDISTAGQWNFCMAITTSPLCNPGSNLSVIFNTSGDGESGIWNNSGCAGDSPAIFHAIGSCCPPNMSALPTKCNGTNTGSATATPVGAAGPYTYNWSGPAAYTSSLSNVAGANSISNVASGIYTVTIIDNNLCAVNATVQVTQPTAVTATPSFTNAGCAGNGTASVTVNGGTPGYTYTWSPSGGNASSASVPAGTYTVTIEDANLCAKTATYNIINTGTINPAFTTPTYTQCLNGNSFVFTALSAVGTHTYSFNPVAGAPAVGNTSTYGPVNFTTAGTYTVTHTIVNGVCAATTTSVIVINPPPVANANSNSPVCVSNNINLTSSGGTSYAWSGPNAFASGIQNPSVVGATLADAGVYTVTVTALGCTNTATVNVVVNSPTTSASNTGPFCQGTTIQLNTPIATTYAWSGPAGFVSNVQNPTQANSTLAMGGTYTVLVSFGTCTASATTSVVVNALPSPTITSNSPVCAGQDINFTGSGGLTYFWFGPNAYSSISQNPTITGATLNNAGTYTLVVTAANTCSNTTTQNVVVNALPSPVANGTTVCFGTNANLTASGGTSYAWNGPNGFLSASQNPVVIGVTNASIGQYTVIVTDANTCTNTAFVIVNVSPIPSPTATSNGTVCLNGIINLNGFGGNTYSWAGPNNFFSTNAAPTVSASSISTGGVYTLTAYSGANCSATETVNMVVNPLPTGAIIGVNKGCAPFCTVFTCTSTSVIQNYNWNLGNGGGFNNGNSIINNCYTTAGIYTISTVLTDVNGCINTVTFTAEAYPKPNADFSYVLGEPQLNNSSEANFTDNSSGAVITNWNWYFTNTNQNQSTQQNPTFVYSDIGEYLIALVVKSNYGCLDTVLKPITISEDFGIWIPNAFTPTEDGINDVFQPKGYGILKYNITIYDRWGEKLYASKNIFEGWDGTYNGQLCKDDVYIWKITVTNIFHKQKDYVGHVSLIR